MASQTDIAQDSDKDTVAELVQVPGYRTQQFLDRGGMGSVYLVEDEALGRWVALKIINPQLSSDSSFIERFQREARIIAQFQHPNIITVHASGRHHQMQYIVMEYVAGGTLRHRIRQGPLPEQEAATIARSMAEALHYSHRRDVIHRDFKPSNVLLRADGTPVLSDFGIARSATVPNGETATGAVIGDHRYMGPERLLGQSVSDRTDIYSFGLVFYEMLTGRLPSDRYIQSDQEELRIVQSLQGVAPHHVQLICACLQFAPEQRPSAADCAARLEPRPMTPPRPKRTVLLASLGVAAVGIASGAWLVAHFSGSRAAFAPLVITPSRANVYIDGVPAKLPEVPRDGKRHEIGIVSPGYVGELIEASDSAPAIKLEPLGMPTLEEHRAFAQQFFNGGSVPAGLAITHAPLLTLLRLKTLPSAAREREAQRIERLAELGDPASQWVAFVATREKLLSLDNTVALGFLKSAMNSGYPLATFYYALYQLDVAGARLQNDNAAYAAFTNALSMARQQGLVDIVDDYERTLGGLPK